MVQKFLPRLHRCHGAGISPQQVLWPLCRNIPTLALQAMVQKFLHPSYAVPRCRYFPLLVCWPRCRDLGTPALPATVPKFRHPSCLKATVQKFPHSGFASKGVDISLPKSPHVGSAGEISALLFCWSQRRYFPGAYLLTTVLKSPHSGFVSHVAEI